MRLVGGISVIALIASAVLAQDSGITRTLLQKFDVPEDVVQEGVFGLAELESGMSIGRHFHYGIEAGYVLAGQLELSIDGEGIKVLEAGESYQIAAGKIHDAKNIGSSPARVNAVWVVEKGKPLSQPVD